jgi:hypothetical protein
LTSRTLILTTMSTRISSRSYYCTVM